MELIALSIPWTVPTCSRSSSAPPGIPLARALPPSQGHPGRSTPVPGVNTVYLRTSNWLKGEYILEMRSRLKESWNAEQLKQMMVRKGSSDSRFHIWKPWTAISIRNIILVLFSTSLPLVSLLYKYTHVMVEQSETLAVIPQHLTFIIQVTTQNSWVIKKFQMCLNKFACWEKPL